MSTSLAVEPGLVRSIIAQVWESLQETVGGPHSAEVAGGSPIEAEIELSGDWVGYVRLSTDTRTAQRIAAAMLAVPDEGNLAAEDVRDAIGEIVNMVGGNVKGALSGTTSLGLPVVRLAKTETWTQPAATCVVRWRGAPVCVEVFGSDHP